MAQTALLPSRVHSPIRAALHKGQSAVFKPPSGTGFFRRKRHSCSPSGHSSQGWEGTFSRWGLLRRRAAVSQGQSAPHTHRPGVSERRKPLFLSLLPRENEVDCPKSSFLGILTCLCCYQSPYAKGGPPTGGRLGVPAPPSEDLALRHNSLASSERYELRQHTGTVPENQFVYVVSRFRLFWMHLRLCREKRTKNNFVTVRVQWSHGCPAPRTGLRGRWGREETGGHRACSGKGTLCDFLFPGDTEALSQATEWSDPGGPAQGRGGAVGAGHLLGSLPAEASPQCAPRGLLAPRSRPSWVPD